jgi:hypothetical protein
MVYLTTLSATQSIYSHVVNWKKFGGKCRDKVRGIFSGMYYIIIIIIIIIITIYGNWVSTRLQ